MSDQLPDGPPQQRHVQRSNQALARINVPDRTIWIEFAKVEHPLLLKGQWEMLGPRISGDRRIFTNAGCCHLVTSAHSPTACISGPSGFGFSIRLFPAGSMGSISFAICEMVGSSRKSMIESEVPSAWSRADTKRRVNMELPPSRKKLLLTLSPFVLSSSSAILMITSSNSVACTAGASGAASLR